MWLKKLLNCLKVKTQIRCPCDKKLQSMVGDYVTILNIMTSFHNNMLILSLVSTKI